MEQQVLQQGADKCNVVWSKRRVPHHNHGHQDARGAHPQGLPPGRARDTADLQSRALHACMHTSFMHTNAHAYIPIYTQTQTHTQTHTHTNTHTQVRLSKSQRKVLRPPPSHLSPPSTQHVPGSADTAPRELAGAGRVMSQCGAGEGERKKGGPPSAHTLLCSTGKVTW